MLLASYTYSQIRTLFTYSSICGYTLSLTRLLHPLYRVSVHFPKMSGAVKRKAEDASLDEGRIVQCNFCKRHLMVAKFSKSQINKLDYKKIDSAKCLECTERSENEIASVRQVEQKKKQEGGQFPKQTKEATDLFHEFMRENGYRYPPVPEKPEHL